jgi:(E)-4-hydroxy-3-methylbut-2-enyl-diphosphate synthase
MENKRWVTREVLVGNVGVGGKNPVRIQSMTTSNTRDVQATVDQIIRLADSGCEIARVTVQGKKEAEACGEIKNLLVQKGYSIPLVADIHFYPPAAMLVAEFVDKIRINPGNFVDKRASFQEIEYTDDSYADELEKIEEKFAPLVEKCKRLNRAIRIGTNHGSLSDRIMNRYGDTPAGMVESAFEFARVCRKYDFHNFIFSMKSSNPKVMVGAYRLLVSEMEKLGWNYPLHLGVTEAGEGEDGRIKSAMGIGSLLLDGIGDTIRVSLTEDPWYEIDPCERIIDFTKDKSIYRPVTFAERVATPYKGEISERSTLHRDGSCCLISSEQRDSGSKLMITTQAPKQPFDVVVSLYQGEGKIRLISQPDLRRETQFKEATAKFALVPPDKSSFVLMIHGDEPIDWELIHNTTGAQFLVYSLGSKGISGAREFFIQLQQKGIHLPVLLHQNMGETREDTVISLAAELGALLCDELGDGVCLGDDFGEEFASRLGYGILQSARMRSTKTEFISCPSCGRTLFNLQEVSAKIRERTDHLAGVKIAIMGCIVNGPGEMADAHFGYVGSKAGMVDLYRGKECVERNIESEEAVDRLVELIKVNGMWIDPVMLENVK